MSAFSPSPPSTGKILITTSDKDQPHLLIKLSGYVTKTAALVPWQLTPADPQAPGSTFSQQLELVNVSEKELRVLYATSDSGGPRLEGKVPPVPANSRQKLKLTWELPKQPGKYSGNLIFYTDHPSLSKLVLPYAVEVSTTAKPTSQPATVPVPSALSGPPATQVDPTGSASPGSATQSDPPQTATQALTAAPVALASAIQPPAARTGVSAPATQPAARVVHLELKDGLTLKDLVEIIAAQLKLNLVYEESALNVPVAIRLSGPLPLLTRCLQAAGLVLGLGLLPALFVGVLLFLFLLRRYIFLKQRLINLVLRLPVVGAGWLNWQLCQLCLVLRTLVASGVQLPSALELAAKACGEGPVAQSAKNLQERLLEGHDLGYVPQMPQDQEGLPPWLWRALAVGQETGELATVLERSGGRFETLALRQAARLGQVLEPALILLVGVFIALVAYPTQEEGLKALTKPLPDKKEPLAKGKLTDPWGHAYVYVYPGNHGKYDLICLGADGVEGGEGENADITSWDLDSGEGENTTSDH